jgi:hypothetical protein
MTVAPAAMAWSAAQRAADQARASLRWDRRPATRLASAWRTSAFAAPGWLSRPAARHWQRLSLAWSASPWRRSRCCLARTPPARYWAPVACRQDEHRGHPRRRLQLSHIRREPPPVPQEPGGLAGTGADDGGRQVLAAGYRGADRVPFLRGPPGRVGGPGPGDRAGKTVPPARRPQGAPGLLLRHPDDPVVHRDARWRCGAPAESAQCHPRHRRQRLSRRVAARGERLKAGGVPVPGHQVRGHALDQGRAPRDPLRHHRSGQSLAGLLVGSPAHQHPGACGASCRLA